MSTDVFKLVDGVNIELTEEENNQRLAEITASKAEQDARAWLDGRLSEYGNWADQLDEMFHDFDGWKERIEAIKIKYPKP